MKKLWIVLSVIIGFESGLKAQHKEISVGEAIPSIEVGIVNYNQQKVDVANFKGRSLILDFWGTWCTPCIKSFPKLDSLQKKFSSELQVLPVSTESSETVFKTLEYVKKKYKVNMPSIVDDSILVQVFPHKYVPHYVWIDKKGIVKAITSGNEITEENIRKLVSGAPIAVNNSQQEFIDFNNNEPIFAGDQLNTRDFLLYSSTISKFIPQARARSAVTKNLIQCTNHSIIRLFQVALGEFQMEYLNRSRLILEGFNNKKDSMRVGFYYTASDPEWKSMVPMVHYCYELALSDTMIDKKQKCALMLQDLNRFFSLNGIEGKKENRVVKELVLVRISSVDKLATKGGKPDKRFQVGSISIKNSSMTVLAAQLEYVLNGAGIYLSVENKTDYPNKVDVDIPLPPNALSIEKLNAELARYDLQLKAVEATKEMIIISKKK